MFCTEQTILLFPKPTLIWKEQCRDTVSTAKKKISSLHSQRVKNKGREVSARYQQAPCRTDAPETPSPLLQVLRVLVSIGGIAHTKREKETCPPCSLELSQNAILGITE